MTGCYPDPVLDEGGACWLASVAATVTIALAAQFASYADNNPDDAYGWNLSAAQMDLQLGMNACIVKRLVTFLETYRAAFLALDWFAEPNFTAFNIAVGCIAYDSINSNGGTLDFTLFLNALGASASPVFSPFLTAIGKTFWGKIYYQYAMTGNVDHYNNYWYQLDCEAC